MINLVHERTPMPEQSKDLRCKNFDEVALGYTPLEAVGEAMRCLNCREKPCVAGCPIHQQIPEFLARVAEGDFDGAYDVITQRSSLPAVCGRVCPQEQQCEKNCAHVRKGEAVAIGRLERFVADWHDAHTPISVPEVEKKGKKVAVIGSGPAGIACAGDLAALGYEVTVFEKLAYAGGILTYGIPTFVLPRSVVDRALKTLWAQGVEIVTSARVTGVERTGEESCTVRYSFKEEERAVEAQLVLCAIGRRPNTQGLFGEGVAPEMERGRILVDESFQTSLPGVYAVGDVSSKIQLAHAATAQGIACVDRLAGRTPEVDAALIPSCIYTSPEIASVGLSADEAKAGGRPVAVGKYVMFSNGKTVIQNSPRGFIKLVAEPETGVLLGAQMMCDRATDMISQLTQAVANRMTVAQLRRVVYPHPTFSEGIGQALEELEKKLTK